MGQYDRFVAMAKRLIAKKGVVITWTKNTAIQNSSQPWKTVAGSAQSYQVPVVYTSKGNPLTFLLAGTNVAIGAPDAIMAQVPFTPEIDDTITDGPDVYVIKSIDIVQPGDVVILYKLTFA